MTTKILADLRQGSANAVESNARLQPINPHILAELNSYRGYAKSLTKYLCSYFPPNSNVLQTTARQLRGLSRLQLIFKIRNGKPPRRPNELWQPGNEKIIAFRLEYLASLFAAKNPVDLPETTISEARTFLSGLVRAIDPQGSSIWKLKYQRPKKGKPPLQRVEIAIRNIQSNQMHSQFGTWENVSAEMNRTLPPEKSGSDRARNLRRMRQRLKK